MAKSNEEIVEEGKMLVSKYLDAIKNPSLVRTGEFTDWLRTILTQKDAWWQQHENDMYESLEEAHKAEIAKAREEERERIRKAIRHAVWNEDGSLKSHDISYIVSNALHTAFDPSELNQDKI